MLMELHLHIPSDLPAGSTITLSDSQPGESQIYSDEHETLYSLTTTGDGTVTWTYDPNDPPPSTLYVAAVPGAGSQTIGDTIFTLSDSPASTTTHPNTTGKTVTTNPASVVSLGVTLAYNPNTNQSTIALSSNSTTNWLVGDVADLTAVLTGPPEVVQGKPYVWDVQGNKLSSWVPTLLISARSCFSAIRRLRRSSG